MPGWLQAAVVIFALLNGFHSTRDPLTKEEAANTFSTYDALNRATVESAQTGGTTPTSLFGYQYGYDPVGNVLTVGETYPSGLNNRTVTNAYDLINRLLTETVTGAAPNVSTTYTYDNANNRLTKEVNTAGSTDITTTYAYNNLNQLTGYTDNGDTRAVSLGYDDDGNRTSRVVTGGSDNGTDTYSYDFENRLVGLVKGTGGGTGTYAYTYDYRTRRIVRDESSAGGVSTALVFSGGTSVQEYDSGSTTPTVEYLRGSDYGGGVGGILYTIRGGTPSYTHENKRGDVVAKTDGTGTLTYQAQYEAFGKQTATTGSTLDRQKSNSKDTDPTGLVDEGFRYRDLETGMFLNRDPAGFVDGPNLYTYVVQNPWTKFDPEGLDADDTNKQAQPPPKQAAKDEDTYRVVGYMSVNPTSSEGPGSKPRLVPIVMSQRQINAINEIAAADDKKMQEWAQWHPIEYIAAKTGLDPGSVMLGMWSMNHEFGLNTAKTAIDRGSMALGVGALTETGGRLIAEKLISRATGGAFDAIGSTGQVGENALKQLGGDPQKYFNTSLGGRYVDQLVNGIANESKTGYQSLTPEIKLQIQKDIELMRTQQVQGAVWNFYRSPVTGKIGPSGPLNDYLIQNNIPVVLHYP